MIDECTTIDRLVTPFVDRELGEDDRHRVEAHIARCPPCHSRVAAEQAVRTVMQARRGDLAAPCAPAALRGACARLCAPAARPLPRARRLAAQFAPFALAATLVLGVGAAFVYQLTESSASVLAAELAADHVKCFALNAVMGTHQGPATVESAMLTGFGWQMHLPPNPSRVNLELVGSRPCYYGEGRIAHLMYRHDGQPVSVFMLPHRVRTEQFVEVLGHQAKIWCVGNRTLVLIAREPRHQVEQLAAYLQASLREGK
jgi:anti-sigma factor RsiW